jgi:hypothetical protein
VDWYNKRRRRRRRRREEVGMKLNERKSSSLSLSCVKKFVRDESVVPRKYSGLR